MKFNSLLAIFLIATLLLFTGCQNGFEDTNFQEKNLKKISVRLPIPFVDATMSPYYVALDKGYYEEEGLDVTLEPGSSETNPVKMVASGVDEFGILGGPDTLLVARSKGIPLVATAVLHRNSDFPVIITLKDSGLTKVEDLQGKKIGFFYGHISTDVLHNLLNKYDIKREEVDVGVDYSQLILGKVDAQWAFRASAAVTLPAKGYEINIISPADYGINTHGLTIFTTQDMIDSNPETVEKFLRATFRGIGEVSKNPKSGVESTIKRNPQITEEIAYKTIDVYKEKLSNSEEYPIGYMNYGMFEETYERLKEENVLEDEFDINDSFTTQFVDKINS